MESGILDKIKKCIEQSKSTDSKSESESAMLLAQKLLMKHNLEMDDIEKHEISTDKGKITEAHVNYSEEWEGLLGNTLCINNFCKAIKAFDKNELTLIGKTNNVEVVLYLFSFFRKRLQELVILAYQYNIEEKRKAFHEEGIDFDSLTSKTKLGFESSYMKNYLLGGVHGVGAKMRLAIEQSEDNLKSLIVINNKSIEKYTKEKFGKLKKGKAINGDKGSGAYRKGLKECEEIELRGSELKGEGFEKKIVKQLNF